MQPRTFTSRRDFLRLTALGASGVLVAACAPAATPTAAPKAAEPTKAPEAAKPTEAPKPAAEPTKPTAAVAKTDLSFKGKIQVWTLFNPREGRTNPFGGRDAALVAMGDATKKWEDLHPGAKIEFFEGPNVDASTPEFRQWMVTQANGDTLPHICKSHRTLANTYLGSGWFVFLDPFYEEGNPYIPAGEPGNKRWMDQWKQFEQLANESKDSNGKQINWFHSYNGRGIYYNPDIFKKAGVEAPKTFEDFTKVCDKIKAAGFIAFQARPKASFGLNQMWNSFQNTLCEGTMVEMDRDKDGQVNTEELARGVKKGLWGAKTPSLIEAWKLAKRTSQYYAPNWNSADTRKLYVTGKLAMTEEASFYMPILLGDKELAFKPAIFDFPQITKDTSQYAADVTFQIKEFAYTCVVTKSAIRDKSVEASVDYLKFISQPKVLEGMVNELAQEIPAVAGTKAVDTLSFFQSPYRRTKAIVFGNVGQEAADTQVRVMENYLLGQTDLEKAMQEWQTVLEKNTDETIKKQNYDPSKW